MNIPAARPYFSEEQIQAISDEIGPILRSGRLILGPYIRRLEESFGEYCRVKHAVGVSSCTAALEIALRYFGVAGKEVIVPTNTFIATSNAVLYAGGKPVLADINPDTLCLDPGEVRERITPQTRGVIVVHIAGLPCPDIDEISAICRDEGLFMLEDVAHAHGAMINGRMTGSIGDAGCFSFYPTKVMTTGTGGMLTTNDPGLSEYACSLRHHGVGKDLNDIVNLGSDWLMDEISALLGVHQLAALEDNIAKRNSIAAQYTEALAGCDGVECFTVPPHVRHSYYKYPVRLSPSVDKRKLVSRMKVEFSVDLGSVYDPPCHLQPVYRRLFGFHKGMFPKADRTLHHTCCLPMFPQMTSAEADYVIQSLTTLLPSCVAEAVTA